MRWQPQSKYGKFWLGTRLREAWPKGHPRQVRAVPERHEFANPLLGESDGRGYLAGVVVVAVVVTGGTAGSGETVVDRWVVVVAVG